MFIIKRINVLLTAVLLSTIPQAHSETRTRILIIDTGINVEEIDKRTLCEDGHYDATGFGIQDNVGHGTNIYKIIQEGLDYKTQCITVIKFFHLGFQDQNTALDVNNLFTNINKIVDNTHYLLVNLSFSGPVPLAAEHLMVSNFINKGTRVVIAAGNDYLDLDKACTAYPTCYTDLITKNMYIVGAYDVLQSNYGSVVKYHRAGFMIKGMTGTSQAAANMSKDLLIQINKDAK